MFEICMTVLFVPKYICSISGIIYAFYKEKFKKLLHFMYVYDIINKT